MQHTSGLSESNKKELLDCLDILQEDLTSEQLQKLGNIAAKIPNPASMKPNEAMELINELGIDIVSVQKKARRRRAEEYMKNKKVKIPVNSPCVCNSGLKYKKCCMKKVVLSAHEVQSAGTN